MLLPTSCGPGPPAEALNRSSIERFDDFSITCKNNTVNSNNSKRKQQQPPPQAAAAATERQQGGSSRRSGSISHSQRCSKPATAGGAAAATTITRRAAAAAGTASATPKWLLMLLLMLFGILAQTPHQVSAEKSKHYYMKSLCKNHFLQQLYRKIDGAVLWSQNEHNLDCIITFQTHSILQRFMLRFDMLQLDCNDHLLVFDGAHAVGSPKIDISCRQTKQSVGSILTRTNFVTLKYVADAWGTDASGFKLVITSVKDPKHTCKDFTCTSREFCISRDLLCDGVNHCGDNSDESVDNLCPNFLCSVVHQEQEHSESPKHSLSEDRSGEVTTAAEPIEPPNQPETGSTLCTKL